MFSLYTIKCYQHSDWNTKHRVICKKTWNDRLGGDAVASVINNHCAQCVQAFNIGACVRLHSLQITALNISHRINSIGLD